MAKLFGISTESFVARYESLTEREKKLTLFAGIFALVFVLGGTTYLIFGKGAQRRVETTAFERQLGDISSLRAKYGEAKAKQDQEAKRFKANNVSLFSLIQNSATRFGVTVYDLNEQKAAANSGDSRLLESNVSLSLKQISIDRLTAFMEGVEDGTQGGVVKIIRLKVKTRFDAPDLLDVQMTVATWKAA